MNEKQNGLKSMETKANGEDAVGCKNFFDLEKWKDIKKIKKYAKIGATITQG